MGVHQVGHMDVVPHAGLVGCCEIGSVDAQFRNQTCCSVEASSADSAQVTQLWPRRLADSAVRVCTCDLVTTINSSLVSDAKAAIMHRTRTRSNHAQARTIHIEITKYNCIKRGAGLSHAELHVLDDIFSKQFCTAVGTNRLSRCLLSDRHRLISICGARARVNQLVHSNSLHCLQ